jgi:hypothetical protein
LCLTCFLGIGCRHSDGQGQNQDEDPFHRFSSVSSALEK